jgi:hypothetical protein
MKVNRRKGGTQVLVHRFPADAVVAREDGFRDSIGCPLDQLGRPFRCLFPPFVGAALLAMPSRCRSLIRERSNSAKAPITESMRLAMGESSPVKTGLSL